MEKMIAKCGIDCAGCTAYQATVKNSDELRRQTAEEWSKMFGAEIDPKSINCMGCQNSETLFSHCQVCGIRSCANEKGHATCVDCPDYGCDKVQAVWKYDDKIKANLDALRGA